LYKRVKLASVILSDMILMILTGVCPAPPTTANSLTGFTAIFGSVLLQVRAAVPVQCFCASVTVVQVILIGFVAVALANPPTSACLFVTVCAMIIGDMGWVGFVFFFQNHMLVTGLPFLIEGDVLFLLSGSFSSHLCADGTVSDYHFDESITMLVARRQELVASSLRF
jgi:hypothetical protein